VRRRRPLLELRSGGTRVHGRCGSLELGGEAPHHGLALQVGILREAVATSSIFNPAASIVLGLALFEEQIHHSTPGRIGAALALLAMFAGIAVLALGRRE